MDCTPYTLFIGHKIWFHYLLFPLIFSLSLFIMSPFNALHILPLDINQTTNNQSKLKIIHVYVHL